MSGRWMLKTRDKQGRLPLHVACSHHAGLDVVQYLVEQYPGAVAERTDRGDLPVTLAAVALSRSPNDEKRGIVYYLLRQYPEMFAARAAFLRKQQKPDDDDDESSP